MKEECLICGAPLKYLDSEQEASCVVCKKTEKTRTICVNGHYVCDACHTKGTVGIFAVCLNEKSKNPVAIMEKLMSLPFCHMHGPEHHIMVGSALLTAYKNAGGKIDLEKGLVELKSRAEKVPGGACGFWGACGAGVSTGMFISVITEANPLADKPWGLANQMTGKSLDAIGKIGGPRCCKRNSYTAIIQAVKFVKENLGVEMELNDIVCSRYQNNNQCKKERCPFWKKEK